MVAENPSKQQAGQRKRWRRKGWDWRDSLEGREAARKRCLESPPSSSPEARAKISKAKMGTGNWMYGRCGPENPNWSGGGYTYNPDFVRLRELIRTRDNYTCQLCGHTPSKTVHHIDYNRKNNTVLNLITVCRSCHGKTNGKEKNRSQWTKRFLKIQSKRFNIPLKVLREKHSLYTVSGYEPIEYQAAWRIRE